MITHDWRDSVTNSYLLWRLLPPCLLSLALRKARYLSSNLRRWPRSQVLRPPPKAKRVSQLGSKASSPAEHPGDSIPGYYQVATQTEWLRISQQGPFLILSDRNSKNMEVCGLKPICFLENLLLRSMCLIQWPSQLVLVVKNEPT